MVAREVDDALALLEELGRELARDATRGREEDDVAAREPLGRHGREGVREALPELRKARRGWLARAIRARERLDVHVRVRKEVPEELGAEIAGGADDPGFHSGHSEPRMHASVT